MNENKRDARSISLALFAHRTGCSSDDPAYRWQ